MAVRALLLCGPVLAEEPEPKYRLSVEAPTKELREMLSKGLQLARWQNDPQMTPELLRRLADEAVVDARQALAADGYFSALVSYSIDRDVTPWSVVIHVQPGTRTTVRGVEITFSGPAASTRRRPSTWARSATNGSCGRARRSPRKRGTKQSVMRCASSLRGATPRRVSLQAARASTRRRIPPCWSSRWTAAPFVFGDVEVRAGERYPEAIVANLSPVEPGTTYDREVLELYTRRLLETGYFAGARVDLAPRRPPRAARRCALR